jgi:hypothetical protein
MRLIQISIIAVSMEFVSGTKSMQTRNPVCLFTVKNQPDMSAGSLSDSTKATAALFANHVMTSTAACLSACYCLNVVEIKSGHTGHVISQKVSAYLSKQRRLDDVELH